MTIDHNLFHKPRPSGGAYGVVQTGGVFKVSITWNEALFHAVNRAVHRNKTSFAHEVRRLVALGLKHDAP